MGEGHNRSRRWNWRNVFLDREQRISDNVLESISVQKSTTGTSFVAGLFIALFLCDWNICSIFWAYIQNMAHLLCTQNTKRSGFAIILCKFYLYIHIKV